jgi:predicted secreted hydrolase
MKIDLRAVCALLLAFFLALPLSLAQFQPALPGYRFEFPRDYFNHTDYQTEWWYYTGNLQATDGRRFGFELTFFRQGVSRDAISKSTWDLRDVYFAHFALSDLDGRKFFHTGRTNRAGPGIAGASAILQKVWNGNWSVARADGEERLAALHQSFAIDLTLKSQKPPVIHGIDGVSQKSAGAGRASHYFSETRLTAAGSLTFDSKPYSVAGFAWMDHEFFTHQLEPDQIGWDWFSLQLDDNSELMLFQVRRKDGSIDPHSSGTLVEAEGRAIHLRFADFQLLPESEIWTSPATHASYPVRWQINLPALDLRLVATTPLPSQELVATSAAAPGYWEGAILLQGKKGSSKVAGSGYLEMTGYERPVSMRAM